ncbi:DEKNAAC101790 [Brettanomyces naardenensis]|uniref:DEKNAAC101790 n=1 Tax=Brettanomyces naardenensis TaxID=13370 RepID=A0A448YJ24_BRENA|nr:DEKNAAC101790 [Brettanomyces naardenensis]
MAENFQFEQWKPKLICQNDIESCQSSQSALASYLTKILVHFETRVEDPDTEDLLDILDQLNLLLAFLTETYDKTTEIALLAVEIDKLLAKDYALLFSLLLEASNPKFATKLTDVTSRMSDLVTANVKKISMKANWYSSMKHMAVIVLQFLFDKFNGFLNSYKEAVLTSLYKHLMKCHGNYNSAIESNIFKANYFTDMVKLIDVITFNDNSSGLLTEKLFQRLLKLTKHLTTRDSEYSFVYPLPAIIHSYNILTTLLKSDRYVSSLSSKKIAADADYYFYSLSKYLFQLILSMDTDHKQLRLVLAKNYADIMVFNYVVFGANRGESDKVLESSLSFLLTNYMKELNSTSIKTGLLETLVQFVGKVNLYCETNSVATGHGQGTNFVALKFFQIMNTIYHHVFGIGELSFESKKAGISAGNIFISKVTNSTGTNDALAVLNELNMVYSFLLRELDSDVNKLILLAKIVLDEEAPLDDGSSRLTSLNALVKSQTSNSVNPWYALTLFDLVQAILADIGEYILSRQDGISESHDDVGTQVARKLFEFCTNNDFRIRVTAVETLVQLIKIEPELAFDLLNTSMKCIIRSFDEKSGNSEFSFNENHGYAFLISSILTYCSKDYVSTDFVLKAFTICTSFLKRFNSTLVSDNLLGSGSGASISNLNYEKQLVSWILLMGLFNYASDSSKVSKSNIFWLDSSQFLNIWKNLLGHALPSGFVQFEPDNTIVNINEIIKLVEIKSYALVCLSSYLSFLSGSSSSTYGSSDKGFSGNQLSPEIAKQVNQILVKSFMFLKNLQVQIGNNGQMPPVLDTRIKTDKLRVYESLIKLLPYLNVRSEMNSSLLLQIVSDFTDINQHKYRYTPRDFSKVAKVKEAYTLDEYEIYRIGDGLNFGLTSKVNGFKVDELMIKDMGISGTTLSNDYSDIDVPCATHIIESSHIKSHLSPVSVFDTSFESMCNQTFAHGFFNDYLMFLSSNRDTAGYTDSMKYPVGNDTVIIDLSVEIFSMVFPYLTAKVQQSIIENIRTAVFYKTKESRDVGDNGDMNTVTKEFNPSLILRKKAVCVNSAVAIHGALSYMINRNAQASSSTPAFSLQSDIVELLVSTLNNFDNNDVYIASLNSASIGMCCALLESGNSDVLTNQISITINSIVENSRPASRAFDVQALTRIAQYSGMSSNPNITETFLTLSLDPHPVVHASALDAIATFISTQSPTELDTGFVWKTLRTLERIWISDSFGIHAATTVSCNMSYREHLSSTVLISRILRAIVNISGPLICMWSEIYRNILRNLLLGLIYLTTDNFAVISREVLKTLEELMVFDKELISSSIYERFIKFLLTNNFRVGAYGHALSCLPINSDDDNASVSELYPVMTSDIIWRMALESYHQLIRLNPEGTAIINPKMERLMWISLEHDATNECVQQILEQLLDDSISKGNGTKLRWLDKLMDYFNMPTSQLLQDLLELFRKRINNGGMFFRAALATKASTKRRSMSVATTVSRRSTSSRGYSEGDEEEAGGALTGNEESLTKGPPEPKERKEESTSGTTVRPATDSSMLLDLESEETGWRFKLVVVDLLNTLLSYASADEKLRNHLADRIPDFVRISFVCSTSCLVTLRVSSLKLLGRIIDIYASVRDPMYPDVSILDQQQAQIVTAIIPAFDRESTVDLASVAIVLASKLVTSRITPVTRLGRVLRILTGSLEEFATQSRLTTGLEGSGEVRKLNVGDISVITKKSQNKIKVHILQAWARIKADAVADDEQLQQLVGKYTAVLVPLWFYSLRDYATMKYGGDYVVEDGYDVDLEAYESSWVDFLNVLSKIAEEDPDRFVDLLGDETANFFFIVFGQCIEFLIKSSSRKRTITDTNDVIVLESLRKLLKLDVALEILFKDLIFPEFVDLLDRLISVSGADMKLHVVELSKSIFEGYFNKTDGPSKTQEEISSDVDKLFELIRLNTLAVAKVLPIVKDKGASLEKISPADKPDLVLLKKSFDSIVEMIGFLPEVIRVDLFSCLLYMFTLIYQLDNSDIISMLLPTLKRTISSFGLIDQSHPNLLDFYAAIRKHLNKKSNNSLLTVLIIVSTVHNLQLTASEGDEIADFIASGITSGDTNLVSLTAQTVKSLIKSQSEGSQGLILLKLIPKLIRLFSEKATELQEPRLVLEILITFIKSRKDDNERLAAYQLIIPILLWFSKLEEGQYNQYVHLKLVELIKFSPSVFKEYIEHSCSDELKLEVEELVKYSVSKTNANEDDDSGELVQDEGVATHISLKTFE